MKKCLLVFILMFLFCFIKPDYNFYSLSVNYNGTHNFYSSVKIIDDNIDITKNGNGYIISCNTKDAPKIKNKINNNFIYGESFSFNGSKNDINIIIKKLKIEILSKQDLDNIIVIEGYSPLINKSIYINNENINIQIAFNNNKITVGYPLILGSF